MLLTYHLSQLRIGHARMYDRRPLFLSGDLIHTSSMSPFTVEVHELSWDLESSLGVPVSSRLGDSSDPHAATIEHTMSTSETNGQGPMPRSRPGTSLTPFTGFRSQLYTIQCSSGYHCSIIVTVLIRIALKSSIFTTEKLNSPPA